MKNKLSATAKVAIPFIILSSQAQIAQAKDSVQINSEGGLELSITANRRTQTIDKTLASVTVITRKDIEDIQAQDLIDVLRLQRGIDIARTGGAGSATSLFMRGTESDHVLILLDGVRVASTLGFDWSQISLDQVERIEIVRGPRAALYGSDAIGGVIEITTRKNAGAYASFTVGRYGTAKASAGFSEGDDKNHVSVNVSLENLDGFSATNAKAANYNADNDANRKRNISASFSRQLTNRHKLGLDLLHSENKVDIDSPWVTDNTNELETINAYLNSEINDRWSQRISVSHANNLLVSGGYTATNQKKEINWQNNIQLSDDSSLILGTNYLKDSFNNGFLNKSIKNKAIYGNFNTKQGSVNFDASLRYDKHSEFGGKTTGQVATGIDLSPSSKVYASYGTAFKAPNMYDLFGWGGNPNLKPEESKTFEVGLKKRIAREQQFEVSAFKTELKNMIQYNAPPVNSSNIDESTIKGLELAYSGKHKKLDWGVDYTWLSAKNDLTNRELVRRPENKMALKLGYDVSERTKLGLDASFVSSRDGLGAVKLQSYNLLNLTASHKLNKHIKVGLRLENVTNEDYELAYGYNTPGRGAYLTFSYK